MSTNGNNSRIKMRIQFSKVRAIQHGVCDMCALFYSQHTPSMESKDNRKHHNYAELWSIPTNLLRCSIDLPLFGLFSSLFLRSFTLFVFIWSFGLAKSRPTYHFCCKIPFDYLDKMKGVRKRRIHCDRKLKSTNHTYIVYIHGEMVSITYDLAFHSEYKWFDDWCCAIFQRKKICILKIEAASGEQMK